MCCLFVVGYQSLLNIKSVDEEAREKIMRACSSHAQYKANDVYYRQYLPEEKRDRILIPQRFT